MATRLLRRFVCPQCGATGSVTPRSPFLRCDSCHTICDFDLGVARRLPEWSRYQALHSELQGRIADGLKRAHAAGDRDTWVRLYQGMMTELATRHPSIFPPGVADSGYRDRYLAWQSSHSANLVFEPELVANQRRINEAMYDLRMEEGRYVAASLWPVLPICIRHFEAQERISIERGPAAPDDFTPGYFRRVGISLTAQEWLTRLGEPEQHELLERLGISHEFVVPEAGVTQSCCGGCGQTMMLDDQAKRGFCTKCGQELAVARGAFDCQACGVKVHVPLASERAVCPFCHSDMHEARAGLEAMMRAKSTLAFIDGELALSEQQAGEPLLGLEVLDGQVLREGKLWRMVTLRAVYAGKREDFFEDTNRPEAPSLADTIGWAEVRAGERKLTLVRRAYHEHPRCLMVPNSEAELDRRLAEMTGGAGAAVVALPRGPKGVACEIEVGGTIVRLVADDEGKQTALCRHWTQRKVPLS